MKNKLEQLKHAFIHLSSIEDKTDDQRFWLLQYNVLLIQLQRPRNKGTNKQFDLVVDQLIDQYEGMK